jgi:protein SCO1/2
VIRFAAVTLVAALLLAGCAPDGPSFRSTDVTGASFGRELALTGHDGKPRTLADFRGKLVVVFFGYTQCPDVCPTALGTLAEAKRRLGADGDKVQGVFVTVDPERDTPELLRNYVPAFDPTFLGLYGDAAATEKAAKEFKVIYRKVPGSAPETYTMDHSAGMYVFDRQGHLRLFVGHGAGADALAHDLGELLRMAG